MPTATVGKFVMRIIGVPRRHRIVILVAHQERAGLRGWLLAKKFFPKQSFVDHIKTRLFARGALLSEFSQAPTTKQVSDVLCRVAGAQIVSDIRELDAVERPSGTGVRLRRHYFQVGDPGFWEASAVLSHRMEFVCPAGADTIALCGEHASYPLGTVGRQVARALAKDARARLAA